MGHSKWNPFSGRDPIAKVFRGVGESVEDFFEDVPVLNKLSEWPGDVINFLADIGSGEWYDTPSVDEIGPTYGSQSGRVYNTITEGPPVSRCYGQCRIGGNKLRFNDPDATDMRVIVAHCRGPVQGITELFVNDVAWGDLTGAHTKTEYTGTRTQTPDSRFSDKASAYRSIAYTAFTFEKDDKQVGHNPTITCTMQGLLCTPLAGGADAFTRNPAVILYDFYRNVEGKSDDDLDMNSFKSLEALCDEIPTGSTLPRYRFDYNFDTDVPANDAKKMIWRSFNGQVIRSQGKLKCVWDSAQMADGIGGLTAKTVSHAFTEDNIVKGSLEWSQPARHNLVRIKYIDSADNYQKTSVEVSDDYDISINGEIPYEETCNYIIDSEIARRRAQLKYQKIHGEDYSCTLKGFSDSSHLEIYDLVTVTHTLPGWTEKAFMIVSKSEDEYGRPTFGLQAYNSSVYDDSQAGTQLNYASTLPNPYVAQAVTSVALAEGGYIAGDGSYQIYVALTFTKPANSILWSKGQVWVSTDDEAYEHYGDAASGDSPGYKIEQAGAGFDTGDTLYVKVLSENAQTGVVQKLSNVSAVSCTIQGKTALPSDVTGFSVSQIGDLVIFQSNRPSQGTDADFSHFELRQGSSWDASNLIGTYTHTKYLLSDYTAGVKKYMIKAVDTSGNKSQMEASKTITLTAPAIQNIFYDAEKISRIAEGTVSNVSRIYNFNSLDGGFFVAGTERMNDSLTKTMNDDATERMWAPGYDSGYFETEAIDVGAEVTGSIFLDIATTNYIAVTYSIQYKISTDNVIYTDYADFVNGVSGTFRYIIFKITLTMDRTNYPEHNVKVSGLYVSVDLPTIVNKGANQAVAIGGTTITFSKSYTTAASIKIQVTVGGSAALIPTVDDKTTTTFRAYVFNISGTDTGGTIDWQAEGY